MASGFADVYSPPRKIPSIKRRAMKTKITAAPHCSYPGSRAISSVTTPKPATEITVVRFLPMVSAKWPNMNAPSGLPINVVAKIIAEAIAAVVGEIVFGMK